MAERKRFVYFGKNQRPSNIFYNGVSFPVAPGDVVECSPDLIARRMDEYREVKPGSKDADKAPRHVFNAKPMFLRKDPTGGLPMKSSPTKLPAHVDESNRKMLMKDDVIIDNPYELIEEQPKIEMSSHPETAAKIKVPDKMVVETSTNPEAPVEIEVEEDSEEEELSGPEPAVDPVVIPGKAVLRKMTKADIFQHMLKVRSEGLPLKPEMADKFAVFDESSTRGPMFEALWEYYGYNEE